MRACLRTCFTILSFISIAYSSYSLADSVGNGGHQAEGPLESILRLESILGAQPSLQNGDYNMNSGAAAFNNGNYGPTNPCNQYNSMNQAQYNSMNQPGSFTNSNNGNYRSGNSYNSQDNSMNQPGSFTNSDSTIGQAISQHNEMNQSGSAASYGYHDNNGHYSSDNNHNYVTIHNNDNANITNNNDNANITNNSDENSNPAITSNAQSAQDIQSDDLKSDSQPAADIVHTFTVKKGDTLLSSIQKLSQQYGWTMVSDSNQDIKILMDDTISFEDYQDGLKKLIDGYPVRAQLYVKNKVVKIIFF